MPRPEFHDLTVCDVRKETDDATSVAFQVPNDLKEAYAFQHGQYLTLRATVNGEDLRRPYSICVTPHSGDLRVCVKRLEGGRFSGFVNDELKPGDTLAVMGPMGRFSSPVDAGKRRSCVAFAGGSGITPVISVIETILEGEPKTDFTLFYGNRSASDIIFRDRLSDLKDRFLNRLRVFHVLSDEIPEVPLFAGMMTEDKVRELVSKLIDVATVDVFFICGPGPMMDGARAALEGLGVAPDRIKIESFGNRPVAGDVSKSKGKPAADDGKSADVEVVFRGLRKKIKVPFEGDAILDAAHTARIDVPFACKGGVCCTCRAKLLEGKVAMDVVYGLEPDEIVAGYILTCQAHPLTDRLVVDYDG